MSRARTRIFHASESEPEVKISGAAEVESAGAVGSAAGRDSALLAKAVRMLSDLLPYAGESYDSMTNAQAKDCEQTVKKVGAFLGR